MKKSAILFFLLFTSMLIGQSKILLIESYHSDYEWDKSYIKGLESVLGSDHNLVKFQMDTKRVPKTEFQKKADEAWKKYEEIKPDLVFLGDDNAAKFLGEKFAQTTTPVVYLGVNNNPRAYKINNTKNITGVLERPLLKRSLASISKILKKDAPKILVLFDDGSTSQVTYKEVFKGKKDSKIGKAQVNIENIGNYDKWKETITGAKAAGFDCVVVGLYHTLSDAAGKHIDANEVLKWTSENSTVPIFGFWDFSVDQDKTAGGFVLFGKVQGEIAAKIALKILKGTSPDKIKPVIPENGRFLFSKKQLSKWQLTLPKDIEKASEFTL